jgi:dTDP-4-amino-4,6-dideoxygalactose transaminase
VTNLVPRYHWEYRLKDVLRGTAAALLTDPDDTTIHLAGIGDCYAVRSGRTALVLAIRSLSLPTGSRIAVPLYCCPVVFEAIVAAGCQPAFVDVDESTYCMSATDFARKVTEVSAAVGVHMFGNVCDFDGLRSVAGGRPLIEDCAQAIGTTSRGRSGGTLGDVAFFSFRCGKYISAGEGGAVYSEQPRCRERLARLVADLPAEDAMSELVHVTATFAKAKLYNRPAYGLVGYPLGRLLDRKLNLSAKAGVSVGRVRKSDLSIARERLASIVLQVERQRAHAAYYSEHLTLAAGMLCTPPADTCCNRYQYPIRFGTEAERDRMADALLTQGIDSARYLDDVVLTARTGFGYGGDCPVSERLSKTTLVIPNSYNLSRRTVRRIVDAVNSSWEQMSNGLMGRVPPDAELAQRSNW